MRTYLLLFFFSFAFIFSCKKDPAPPIAKFTFANNNCEGPCEVTFINESANADQFGWDFGDGIKSTDKNPRHAYAKGGKYAVTLSAIGKGGTMTFTDTITIKNSKPNADFDIQQLTEGQIKVSSKGESSTTYQWTFGDGGTGSGSTINYTYKANGTFTIILTATGPGGQSTATKTVTITSISKPSANFDVEYMANGEVRLVSKFGSSTTYQWNFGDGTIGSGPDPYHTYKNNGNYTVTLTATGPGGQSTSFKTIQITNIATTGQGIIYLTRNGLGAIDVYIGGSYEGRITVYYSSSTPTCGETGNVTITRPAGVYNVTAKAANGSAQWSGTITIANGKCNKLGLD